MLGALAAPATASAATRKIEVDASIRGGVQDREGPPYAVYGSLRGGGMRGAMEVQAELRGSTFSGRFVYRDAHGTFRGTSAGEVTGQEGDVVRFVDRLTVTGGTGRYRRARGRIVEEGTTDLGDGLVVETVRGTLRVESAKRRRQRPRPRRHAFSASANGAIAGVSDGVGTVVLEVEGLTGRDGLMILEAPQGTETATVGIVYYDGAGSLRGTADIRREPQPDGSIRITGLGGGFTSGTGRYRDARQVAARTFSGTRSSTANQLTLRLTGTLRY